METGRECMILSLEFMTNYSVKLEAYFSTCFNDVGFRERFEQNLKRRAK